MLAMVIEDQNSKQPQKAKPKVRVELANPIDRVAATIVDFLFIIFPAILVLGAPYKKDIVKSVLLENDEVFAIAFLALIFIGLICIWLYQTLLTYFYGFTVGKLFLGLRVKRIWSESHLSFYQCAVRSVVWIFEALLFFLPFLEVLSNVKRRSLHDRFADTIVISVRQKGIGKPSQLEQSFVNFIFAFIFVIVMSSITFYVPIILEQVKEVKRMEEFESLAEFEVCKKVTDSLENWPTAEKPERIDVAMTLFAAEELTESCLEREADYVFINEEESAVAYLANSFVYSENPSLSDKYLHKVCELDSRSTECKFSLFINNWNKGAAQAVSESLSRLIKSNKEYVQVWLLRHHINNFNYDAALELVDRFKELPGLSAFWTRQKSKIFWGLNRKKESRVAASVAYQSLNEADGVELASWICFEELESGCKAFEAESCKKISNYFSPANETLQDPRIAISYIRYNECNGKVDYEKHILTHYRSDLISVLEAMADFEQKSSNKAIGKLLELAEDESSHELVKFEALRRVLKLAENKKDLIKVFEIWSEKEKGLEQIKLGKLMLKKFFSHEMHEENFIIGQKLFQQLDKGSEEFKSLILSSYYSGHQLETYKMLKNNSSEQGRQIASNPSLIESKFTKIKAMLIRRYNSK